MVCAILAVVEFDDEVAAVDAVVVRFALVERAGPGPVQVVEALRLDLAAALLGQLGGDLIDVDIDEAAQDAALGVGHAGGGQALFGRQRDARGVEGEDVPGRFGIDHGVAPLGVVEAADELPGDRFAVVEDAQALARTGADFGGVCAEEERGVGEHAVAPERVVERDVMAFDAPAPGRFVVAGFAEDGPVVELGVAHEGADAGCALDLAERGFQLDDFEGLFGGVGGEPGVEQGEGELALGRGHIAQGEAVAVGGRVVPEDALGIEVVVAGAFALGGEEAVDEASRDAGHAGDGGAGGCGGHGVPRNRSGDRVSRSARAGLAVAAHDPLVGAQLAQPHGAAGVEFAGGDADFRAEAEFAAVGELG